MIRASLVLGLLAGCTGDDPLLPNPIPDPVCTQATGEICTVAGSGQRGFNGDLDALESHLFLPTAVSFYPDGHLLVVDFNNMRLRRLEDDGTLTTVMGSGIHAYATDGIDALDTALENPVDAAVAPDGTMFVMELHGARVLEVDPTGWLTVYAGSPTNPGYESLDGDGLPAREASMSQSVGLTLADDGSLFIADTNNHAVREVDPDGIMHTLAGNGVDGFDDGVGPDASFHTPQHLTWHDGFVFVADQRNHALRRVEVATGEVVTLAGTGVAGFSGDGGPATEAQLSDPQGVAVAEDGRIFLADSGNHVIRLIDLDGTIQSVVGQPELSGFEGDFGPASEALLSRPNNVAIHGDDLYVVDTFNDVIRLVYDGAQ